MITVIAIAMITQSLWMIYRDLKMINFDRKMENIHHQNKILQNNYNCMVRENDFLKEEISRLT